jgi:hypothetical protein
MIAMIVGVAAGVLVLLGIFIFVARQLRQKHKFKMQKSRQEHDFELQESSNRGAMLRLADTPQGLRALELMGAGRQIGGRTNRAAITTGPYGGGGGRGQVFEAVSLI